MVTEGSSCVSHPLPTTLLRIEGKDASKFLHRLSSNNIEKLESGRVCEAFACDAKGRVLWHWVIAKQSQALMISTVAGEGDKIYSHLDRFHFREDLSITNLSPQWRELVVWGRAIEDLKIPAEAVESLMNSPYASASVELPEGSVLVQRFPKFGGDVLHLFAAEMILQKIADRLLNGSASSVSADELELRRIQMGWPIAGIDFDDKTLPQELARDTLAISFTKGCYLGQETVARLDALGQVQRRLIGFRFTDEIPQLPLVLSIDGKELAHITSAAFSPALGCNVGLGFARRSLFPTGKAFQAEQVIRCADIDYTTTSLPIVPPTMQTLSPSATVENG